MVVCRVAFPKRQELYLQIDRNSLGGGANRFVQGDNSASGGLDGASHEAWLDCRAQLIHARPLD